MCMLVSIHFFSILLCVSIMRQRQLFSHENIIKIKFREEKRECKCSQQTI